MMEEIRQLEVPQPTSTEVFSRMYPSLAAFNQVQTTTHDPFQGRRQIATKLVQTINLVFGTIDALIAIRVLLRLLGANPNASFAAWTYGMTDWLTAPFAGLFSAPAMAGSVLEVNAIVALSVYALVAWMLGNIAWLVLGETHKGLIAHARFVRAHAD
jgi:hypothetical protein